LLPRRLEDPAPQPRYVLLTDAPVHDDPIEHALRSVHLDGVQLALSVREIIGLDVQRLTCSRQHPFEPSHQDRYPTGSPQPPSRRRTAPRSRVPLPFGYQPSLLEHPVPAEGFRPSHDRPTGPEKPDPDRVSTFHADEMRPARAPSIPRDQRCSHDWPVAPSRRSPHFQRQVLYPGNQPVDLSFN
jgi:hypothetical protein